MKKLIINKPFVFSALFLLIPLLGSSQTILWTEDFESGGGNWMLNTTDMSSTNTGYNEWVLNNAFAAGNENVTVSIAVCGDFGCFGIPVPAVPNQPAAVTGFPQSTYMHILYDAAVSACVQGNLNAHYLVADPAGLCVLLPENYFTEMNIGISTVGQTNVTVSFWWTGITSSVAVGEFYYSTDSGSTWNLALGGLWNQATWNERLNYISSV